MKRLFYNKVQEKLKENKDVHVITIVRAPQDKYLGSKILKVDNEFIYENKDDIEFYKEIINNIDLNENNRVISVSDDKEVFIEHLVGKPSLIICGGGHIALPLSNLGKMLDFNVTVIDDRKEFANAERFKIVDNIICEPFEDALKQVSFNNNAYFVIVTRGHKDDKKCLEIILKNKFKYVGMIGSKGKVAKVVRELLESDYTKEDIEKVHAPIGLRIGAQTPAEISVSIAAEIIEVKNKSNLSSIDDEILNSIKVSGKNTALVTILDKIGSSPRGQGAKMLVLENGDCIGTIGGGSVENAAYNKALEVISARKSVVESYDLSNSAAAKLGMACGGKIKVLIEFI